MAARPIDLRDLEDLLELGLHFPVDLLTNFHFLAIFLKVHTLVCFLRIGHFGVLT